MGYSLVQGAPVQRAATPEPADFAAHRAFERRSKRWRMTTLLLGGDDDFYTSAEWNDGWPMPWSRRNK